MGTSIGWYFYEIILTPNILFDYNSSLSFQSSWKGRIQESFDYCNWLVTQQIRLGDWNLRLWFFSFGILIEEASLATQTEETSRIEVHLWVYKLILYSYNFCFTIICRLYYLRVVHSDQTKKSQGTVV